MEMIDVVLDEVVNSTRNKLLARKIGDRVKLLLAHAMPEDYEEIDLTPDLLVMSIGWILTDVKGRGPIEPKFNILFELLTLQKYLYWQCSCNVDQLHQYRYYINNFEKVYEEICEDLNNIEKAKFTFELDYAKPLRQTLDDIDCYCSSLKVAAKSLHKILLQSDDIGCKGLMPFLVFHHEVIGNEAAWEEKLTYWQACYKAYILHHVQNMKKADIVRALSQSPFAPVFVFNLLDMPNATHKLNGFIEEAKRLIASVERGTFPY